MKTTRIPKRFLVRYFKICQQWEQLSPEADTTTSNLEYEECDQAEDVFWKAFGNWLRDRKLEHCGLEEMLMDLADLTFTNANVAIKGLSRNALHTWAQIDQESKGS